MKEDEEKTKQVDKMNDVLSSGVIKGTKYSKAEIEKLRKAVLIKKEIEKVKASSTIGYYSGIGIGYNNERRVRITIDGYQYWYKINDSKLHEDYRGIGGLIDSAIEEHINSDDYKNRYKHW